MKAPFGGGMRPLILLAFCLALTALTATPSSGSRSLLATEDTAGRASTPRGAAARNRAPDGGVKPARGNSANPAPGSPPPPPGSASRPDPFIPGRSAVRLTYDNVMRYLAPGPGDRDFKPGERVVVQYQGKPRPAWVRKQHYKVKKRNWDYGVEYDDHHTKDEIFGTSMSSLSYPTPKWVVITFVTTWCPQCDAYRPYYEQVSATFAADDDVLVAEVNCQKSPRVCQFLFVSNNYPVVLMGETKSFVDLWKDPTLRKRLSDARDARYAKMKSEARAKGLNQNSVEWPPQPQIQVGGIEELEMDERQAKPLIGTLNEKLGTEFQAAKLILPPSFHGWEMEPDYYCEFGDLLVSKLVASMHECKGICIHIKDCEYAVFKESEDDDDLSICHSYSTCQIAENDEGLYTLFMRSVDSDEANNSHPEHANFWDIVKSGAETLLQVQPVHLEQENSTLALNHTLKFWCDAFPAASCRSSFCELRTDLLGAVEQYRDEPPRGEDEEDGKMSSIASWWFTKLQSADGWKYCGREKINYFRKSKWQECRRDDPEDSFACGMWILLHSLSVMIDDKEHMDMFHDHTSELVKYFIPGEYDIDDFWDDAVKYFPKGRISADPFIDVPMWLWNVHNFINEELREPLFPPDKWCPMCFDIDDEWDPEEVLRFLRYYYHTENIEQKKTMQHLNGTYTDANALESEARIKEDRGYSGNFLRKVRGQFFTWNHKVGDSDSSEDDYATAMQTSPETSIMDMFVKHRADQTEEEKLAEKQRRLSTKARDQWSEDSEAFERDLESQEEEQKESQLTFFLSIGAILLVAVIVCYLTGVCSSKSMEPLDQVRTGFNRRIRGIYKQRAGKVI